jgi:twitching motility protein PilT
MDSSLAALVRDNKITMAVAETRSSEPGEMRKLVHSGVQQPSSMPPSMSPPAGVAA